MSSKRGIEFELEELGLLAPVGYFIGLHIRFAAPLLTFANYPAAWTKHYTEQAFALRDPIVGWGFSTNGTIRWSEVTIPDTFNVFGQAADFGLVYGAAFSMGEMSSRTIGTVARDDREFTDDEIQKIYACFKRLHDISEPPDRLTKAQTQALRLIGEGMRYTQAAAEIGISESALKARLTSARHKLLARTTAEAVQKARQYNLL